MSTEDKILDGRKLAAELKKLVAAEVNNLNIEHRIIPSLAIVRVGKDPASLLYVKKKLEQAAEIGIKAQELYLPDDVSEAKLEQTIEDLNDNVNINGILVQLPLPPQFNANEITACIDPLKDVDGLTPHNVGSLSGILGGLAPCTPLGCMMLLQSCIDDMTGMHAVIIGKSNLVGKPLAQMLLQENCTVTIVHSQTKNITEITRQADILISATGQAKLVKADWVKKGAYVIDVGISNADGNICGDVDFARVIDKVAAISPVPGGVGPMTVACLMLNTTLATCIQHDLDPQFMPSDPLRDRN